MNYIKLLRIKHYIKNFLVFLPLFFGKSLFDLEKLSFAIIGFFCFSLIASTVYIVNDIKDIEKDKNHPTKKNRPIASGKIGIHEALIIAMICLSAALIVSFILGNTAAAILLIIYLFLNIAYSLLLKNIPIIDIIILASGFIIRIFYGGFITNTRISVWLYLVIITGSLYMGLGKRRNEIKEKNTREVLKYYNVPFLDKNMYVCMALADVFYSLWTMELETPYMIWTVPAFIIIMMRYSLDIENDSDGDPIEVIWNDKILICFIILYSVIFFLLLYII